MVASSWYHCLSLDVSNCFHFFIHFATLDLPKTKKLFPRQNSLEKAFSFAHYRLFHVKLLLFLVVLFVSLLYCEKEKKLMSLAVEAKASSSNNMGLDSDKEEGNSEKKQEELEGHNDKTDNEGGGEGEHGKGLGGRRMSESSLYATEEEEDDGAPKIQLGPQCTLKEQLEKDKDDESLRKWKEQLLGSVDINDIGETLEPEVQILSLSILSPGRDDLVLSIPESGNPKGSWFTLKEGSPYSLKFSFIVKNNIVSGLRYTNTVWKTGVKVERTKEMIGTFSPQQEPYTHVIPEDTTPSGMFARGSYTARTKFLDDDNKCYLEMNYTFDIRKEWAAT